MRQPLRIATCQFSVEADIDFNREAILGQTAEATEGGARVVHFSECALSGYAGVDFADFSNFDWELLRRSTDAVCRAAAENGVWVLLGSAHPLSEANKPHNCVYVISDEGRVVERYDKRFCTGEPPPGPEFDLGHYTPGDHTTVFDVDGWRCGVLICYDYRFGELYRELKQAGVEVLFQSFHNARRDRVTHETGNVWRHIVPATMMCRAAENHFWISANNSTARYSSWPSFCVQPDGLIVEQLAEHESGVLICEADDPDRYWDAPAPWRDRAMSGRLHSGETVRDPRSSDRTAY